jgi:hypothetical protein
VRINFQPIGPDAAWHPTRGAPKGNRNALRAGAYSAEFLAFKTRCRTLIAGANALLAQIRAERRPAPSRLADSDSSS